MAHLVNMSGNSSLELTNPLVMSIDSSFLSNEVTIILNLFGSLMKGRLQRQCDILSDCHKQGAFRNSPQT